MKKSVAIVLSVVCALCLLTLPFVLSSPDILNEAQRGLWDEEGALVRLFPGAAAEEEPQEVPVEEEIGFASGKVLPLDLNVGGSVPVAENFTGDSYLDDTISVRMETVERDGVVWRVAYVRIADPSQLRTAIKGKPTQSGGAEALPSSMAAARNAIVAIGGDNFRNEASKKTFEYRQGVVISDARNQKKDALVIDENGDFHTVILLTDEHLKELKEELAAEGHSIINAFTFGPVLVKDGQAAEIPEGYGYDASERNPRVAIAQMGELSYAFILAEGRTASSRGATCQEMADFAAELGCVEAFNLDGGNSAVLIFNGEFYMDKNNKERTLNDIIYFASAHDAESGE